MKYPVRCRQCNARRSLPRHPDEYKRLPACRSCGNKTYTVDTHRMKNPDSSCGGPVCKLDCLPYPHRVNDKNCKQHEEFKLNQAARGVGGIKCTDPEPQF